MLTGSLTIPYEKLPPWVYTMAVQRSPYQEPLRENRVPYEPVQVITKTGCPL